MGVGLDAFDFGWKSFSDSGPVVNLSFGIGECNFSVRVDNACHAKVLPYALTAFLVLCLHLSGDFSPMLLGCSIRIVPNFTSLILLCGLVLSCVEPNVHDRCGGFTCDF